MGVDGVIGVQYGTEPVNEEIFCRFLEKFLLPQLLPFNSRSVMLLDNASIHHTERAIELIQSIEH